MQRFYPKVQCEAFSSYTQHRCRFEASFTLANGMRVCKRHIPGYVKHGKGRTKEVRAQERLARMHQRTQVIQAKPKSPTVVKKGIPTAQWVRGLRKHIGATQRELAMLISNRSDNALISKWELGTTKPSPYYYEALFEVARVYQYTESINDRPPASHYRGLNGLAAQAPATHGAAPGGSRAGD